MAKFERGRYSKPNSAYKNRIPVEDWAVDHVPRVILVDVPRKLGLSTMGLRFKAFDTQFSIDTSPDGWELACNTNRRLPGDWLESPVTCWPHVRGDARDSWYAAGDGVSPPKDASRHPDWVFYRALWVTYEKLTRELATEYARRVHHDRSLHDGPRDSVIPTLRDAFTISTTRTGYLISCCDLRKRLSALPSWDVFDG